jgi:hypothetical protein
MSPERTPTETSPLLGPQSGNAPTNGAITNNILRDPEADPSKDDLAPRHNLRYILPAVSLGVGLMSYNSNILLLTPLEIDLPVCSRSDDHCGQLRADRFRPESPQSNQLGGYLLFHHVGQLSAIVWQVVRYLW